MKIPSRVINGVFLLDKDSGASSNRVLQQTKRIFNASKAGHTGSLDPLASGVLPICFGEATKFARFLLDANKTYVVRAQLGVMTDSGDSEGTVIAENPVPTLTADDLKQQISQFMGAGKQVPSMFSALKHNGQRLYKLARQNIVIDRPARDIYIYGYELLEQTSDTITCKITCSKGTYIRTLIEDLGHKLGCGAHVTMLRRVQAGPFTIDRATNLQDLADIKDKDGLLLPMECLLADVPKIVLSSSDAQYMRHGRAIQITDTIPMPGIVCLVTDQDELLGIAEASNAGNITPLRLVATQLTVL